MMPLLQFNHALEEAGVLHVQELFLSTSHPRESKYPRA
jgi:hypothetical protein